MFIRVDLCWYSCIRTDLIIDHTETYLDPSQTSKMELFTKIVYGRFSRLLFLQKISIVDLRLGSKYASVSYRYFLNKMNLETCEPLYPCSTLNLCRTREYLYGFASDDSFFFLSKFNMLKVTVNKRVMKSET